MALYAPASAAKEKCIIANSHYTGWEPIWLAKHLGIFKKWGDKYGVEIDVTEPMDYGESITQFAAPNGFCALAVTNMDALTGPAAGGVGATFIVVGDYSNGNDGYVWKSDKPLVFLLKDILENKTFLVQNTVSHYLLWRAAQLANIPFGNFKIEGAASETDVKNAYRGEGSLIITWNPILMTAKQEKNTRLLFDSSSIPGEIVDGIVVRDGTSGNVKKAIAGAWYEVMTIMAKEKELISDDRKATQSMAKFAGNTAAEFEAQLKTTALFHNPQDAVKFTSDAKLKTTMELVRTFAAQIEALGKNNKKDFVGIQFPDGSVMGDKSNVKLRFDTTFMQLAADGKL